MRDYQSQKNNKYILPTPVYNQALWIIRDYNRMKEEARAILEGTPQQLAGMPHGSGVSDPVAAKVRKREKYIQKTEAIDAALAIVPEEYRSGVFDNVIEHKAYPLDADRSTYSRWKSAFIYAVAVKFEID